MSAHNERTRIILTGGGTGGHVYPALAVAAASASDGVPSAEFLYVGTNGGLERDIVAGTSIPFGAVEAGAIRGRSPLAAAAGSVRIVRGMAQARAILRRVEPSAVLATGGFVCVPVVLAARLSGIPSVVYLPDLRPGWAVRFLARIATVVAVSFEEVVRWIPARRVEITGYPVRPELLTWSRVAARRTLGIPPDAASVLVLGGSRGAQSINLGLARGLEALLERAWVVHATGKQNYEAQERQRAALSESIRERYRLYPYLDAELGPALASADLVVARSGASTLAELPAVGAPGLVVPYPHAGAHQRLNAEFLRQHGAAVICDDGRAREGGLVPTILELIDDRTRLNALAAGARTLARPDAARRLYDLVVEVGAGRRATVAARRSGT
jgi:UDP-N-acetylglucosamine--N-acetylmuramyl-(pentapeptide) pyrophosphoryl-undecaprenol N-acetylglucosamine transferase